MSRLTVSGELEGGYDSLHGGVHNVFAVRKKLPSITGVRLNESISVAQRCQKSRDSGNMQYFMENCMGFRKKC